MNLINKLRKGNPLFYLMALLVFILPIVFLPVTISSLSSIKIFTFGVLTILTLVLLFIASFKSHDVRLPFNLPMTSVFSIVLVYLASTLFAINFNQSFLGFDLTITSFVTIALLCILLFLAYKIINDTKKIFYIFLTIAISFLAMFVFHALVFYLPFIPDMGFFFGNSISTLGTWVGFSAFAGLVVIISSIVLTYLKENKSLKILAYVSLVLALFVSLLLSIKEVWYIIAITTLFVFLYELVCSFSDEIKKNRKNTVLMVVFFISILAILFSGSISGFLQNTLRIDFTELHPTWSGTFSVMKDVYSAKPVLGYGPGSFAFSWNQFKPDRVLGTEFFDVDFNFAVGYIPTLMIDTGILGLLSWVFFLAMIVYFGIKLLIKSKRGVEEFITLAVFATNIYLWAVLVVSTPGIYVISLAFIFAGILFALVLQDRLISEKSVSFVNKPKIAMGYTILLVIIVVSTVFAGYGMFNRFAGNVQLQKGFVALNATDLTLSQEHVAKSISLNENELNRILLSRVGIVRLNQIINNQDTTPIIQSELSETLTFILDNQKRTIQLNPNNYRNYILLGDTYAYMNNVLGFEGSYVEAENLYKKAKGLSIKNPAIDLKLARFAFNNNRFDDARVYLDSALSLKPNYLDAIFLLSGVDAEQGKLTEAIKRIEAAATLQPNNPAIFFELGVYQFRNKAFQQAVNVFERAVILNPVFQNAKYFLGLSYYEVGRTSDAIVQFENLVQLNPDNQVIREILQNLKSGGRPFIDNTVTDTTEEDAGQIEEESTEELPLEE